MRRLIRMIVHYLKLIQEEEEEEIIRYSFLFCTLFAVALHFITSILCEFNAKIRTSNKQHTEKKKNNNNTVVVMENAQIQSLLVRSLAFPLCSVARKIIKTCS